MSREVLYVNETAQRDYEVLRDKIASKEATITRYYQASVNPKGTPDFREFAEYGGKLFILDYFKRYGKLYPEVVNRAKVFKDATGVTIEGLNQLKDEYLKLINHATTEKRFDYSIAENGCELSPWLDYNVYLDESKREDYELAKELLDVSNKLIAKYKYSGHAHIQRFAPANFYRTNGVELSLNLQYFGDI